ncbi:glycosyltransferase family 1 protein [Flammeovirgaceae bacterium SG7u.111]|nr:glycosyltransferase family 1 protein [Flammeovirgaceae bacterium SG7u.132]WPO34562.1 glycosyltransferase family 1 protein [Flammeovirgaceae bacterium SG7u.111]
MKITYISCRHANCGIGRYTSELANYVYDQEDVQVYRKGEGDKSFINAYPYRSFRSLKDYIAPYYLYQAIKNEDSTIWHADYPDAITSLHFKKKTKGKVVTTVHDAIPYLFYKDKLSFKFYEYNMKQAMKYSDAFIVVSKQAKEDLIRFTNISEDRVHVIYNGINHDFFYPGNVTENETFTIRYIGGLGVPHKNAIALVETARILEKANVKFRLEIGSGIGTNTQLAKLIEEYGLKNVYFNGFIPDVELRSFLAGADLFFYPSLYEGFGFPPLEAMACGTAVVAANKGSLPEVLGNASYLVDPNPEDFANAIIEVMGNAKMRQTMQEKGIAQALKYHWSKAGSETLSLYHSLA